MTLKQIETTLQAKCTDGKVRDIYMDAIDEEGYVWLTRDHGSTWEIYTQIDEDAHYEFAGETLADIFEHSSYGSTFEYEA
jgi:hypothetical protein